jgi:hypothetical protein
MNDNLRYISLQYIKGNNYDKVTCFSFNNEQFKDFLDKNKNANEKDLFYSLEETKKSKCEIGESLLDDLINYIEFKELIPLLETAIINVDKRKNTKKESDETGNETGISKEFKKLFNDLTNIVRKIQNKKDGNKEDIEAFEKVVKDLVDKLKYDNNNVYESLAIAQSSFTKYNKEELAKYQNTILKKILEELEKIKGGNMQRNILTAKNILKYFNLIYEILTDDIIEKKASKKKESEDSDKLIKLYNKYIYICKSNIKKYEKIFEYNEIDNIDDAFMIVSYSKFLKKLRKIKESLESKDIGKIERNLVYFLNKFFHLHGFNPENIKEDIDINYLVKRILNYS